MASMNWLGFSLSPQAQQDMSNIDVPVGECYMVSDSAAPNLPASFDMLEAFHRDNQSQDWNLEDAMGMNSTTSACNNQELKLENFLDTNRSLGDASSFGHGHTNGGDYSYSHCGLQLPFSSVTDLTNPRRSSSSIDHNHNNNNNNNGINVSMIKTWLRNQPAAGVEGGALTSPQTLSLSMTSGVSETSTPPFLLLAAKSKDSCPENVDSSEQQEDINGVSPGLDAHSGAIEVVPRKAIDTFGQRTSIYRGVTRHRWTGRYEAHLWDNSSRREGQTRKGRQVYLGGYDKEDKAARSYDLAAVKYWGTSTTTNFPISSYEKEIEEMKNMTRQEYVASLRRNSSGFSRGASIYRGVTRHHQHGRWQARIGRVAGNKDLYLGTFSTQEEAAEAYDIAAIKFRGLNAVTNFEINRYDVKAILESSSLPIGGAGKRMKDVEELTGSDRHRSAVEKNKVTSGITLAAAGYHSGWPAIAFQQPQPQPLSVHYQYSQQPRLPWFKQEHDSGTSTDGAGHFQDVHQLHQGNTHSLFHQPSAYNLMMRMDGSSMENGYGSNDGGFMMPMGTAVIAHEVGNGSQMSDLGENAYYQQANENWIPTAVPAALAPRTNNVAVCHGAQTFTVWNDT